MKPPGKRWAGMTMRRHKEIGQILICVVIGLVIGTSLGVLGHFFSPTEPAETAVVSPPTSNQVTFRAVGDILMEEGIYDYLGSDYDFQDYFTDALPYLTGDVMLMNQETIIGGDDQGVKKDNYVFNTPTRVADQLVDLGFNMVSLANNHCLDMGQSGLDHSLAYWQAQEGLITSGTYATPEDRQTPRILEKNGIRFGFLAYTTFTNKKWLEEDEMYKVGYSQALATRTFDEEHRAIIKQEVEALRPLCDVLVVSCHWGVEGSFEVADSQREMAAYLNELGVDMIIGTHPHVMQPCEWIEDPESGHRTFVAYSLGNFISSDADVDAGEASGDAYSLSGILGMTITKEENGISMEDITYTPLVNHFTAEHTDYHLYPIALYNETLASQHARQPYSPSQFELAAIQDLILDVMDNGVVTLNMKGSAQDG